jgi:hypothetical protein
MAFLTVTEIQNKFSIKPNLFTSQIGYAIDSAALTIRKGVESDIYDEAYGASVPTDTEELIRQQSVVEAHSYLTMWFLIGNVGVRLASDGFVKQAQDSGSPALNSRIVTNSYLTPKDLEVLRAGYLEQAEAALGEYGTLEIEVEAVVGTQTPMQSLNWF